MAIITEDYVSFEIAKLLKEKGFNEIVSYAYDDEGMFWEKTYHPEGINIGGYDAPTLQMVMKWLREIHNIHISVYVFNRELPITNVPVFYTCDIATEKLSSQQGHLRGVWKSYEEACEAAIKDCLENLI